MIYIWTHMYTQWLLKEPRTITLYTHECVYTQCFPVRFALRKIGASLSIEMTVALEVLWFTNYHEQRCKRLPPRLNCLHSQQVDRLGACTKSATNGRPAKPLTRLHPELRQHIKVSEKLNMSLVELIHPSQTEWMSPISLFDKIRMEIYWDLARTSLP